MDRTSFAKYTMMEENLKIGNTLQFKNLRSLLFRKYFLTARIHQLTRLIGHCKLPVMWRYVITFSCQWECGGIKWVWIGLVQKCVCDGQHAPGGLKGLFSGCNLHDYNYLIYLAKINVHFK